MNTLTTTNNEITQKVIPGHVCKDISAEAFMSFIASLTTNIGRATFYNLKEEQRQVMIDQHQLIFERARPLYALLMLPESVNDVNKSLILYNLVTHTYRDPNISVSENDPLTMWENEIAISILKRMPPPRVFDFFEMLSEQRFKNKRTSYLFFRYIRENRNSLPLWALKYRRAFKRSLRHFHADRSINILQIWRFLKYNETTENSPPLLLDYKKTQEGDVDALFKLPLTVAEGFRTKFGLSMEDFTKRFTKKGKLTTKEKKLRVTSVRKATEGEVETGFDIRKANLFDSLVFIMSQKDKLFDSINMNRDDLRNLLNQKARKIAERLPFEFNYTAIILDNSISMIGTGDQKFHPLLRAVATSLVIQNAGTGNVEFRIYDGNGIIPKIGNQSNYADILVAVLKTNNFENVVMIGDGYENAPFQGAVHQIIYSFKKKIDKKNKVSFFHINPVFASETKDVRELSELAPAVGIREIETFPETMFVAIGKSRPAIAAKVYLNNLIEMQPERAKTLMPQTVKKALTTDSKKLLV